MIAFFYEHIEFYGDASRCLNCDIQHETDDSNRFVKVHKVADFIKKHRICRMPIPEYGNDIENAIDDLLSDFSFE